MKIFHPVGGLGIFLLGMIIMTEGLRALAGNSMHRLLVRFTRSPWTGVATGAGTTAILQSSSATTVATIGFVGAGLLTYPQALGIVLGANIGTTITGWLVALVGFKLKLGILLLPLVLFGAVLRLFTRNKWQHVGFALAGFGLIFVGIASLQEGMLGLKTLITFEQYAPENLVGALRMAFLAAIFTIVTQSSSAGVAMTMVLLTTGTITYYQGVAMVIGMDIGTTVTAAIASIGGTVNSKRTAWSHVIYNLMAGSIAILLIKPWILLCNTLFPGQITQSPAIMLVAFHTTLNTIGVLTVTPFAGQFVKLLKFIFPSRASIYTGMLAKALLKDALAAMIAVRASLQMELRALLRHLVSMLDGGAYGKPVDLAELQRALNKTHTYTDKISGKPDRKDEFNHLLDLIHVLDHMQRLHERCEEETGRAIVVRQTRDLTQYQEELLKVIASILGALDAQDETEWEKANRRANEFAQKVVDDVEDFRFRVTHAVAEDRLTVHQATEQFEAIRWLERVSVHLARIMTHLQPGMISRKNLPEVKAGEDSM